MRQIIFEIPAKNGYPLYRDALWVADDAVLSDSDIETMRQARHDAWKTWIDTAADFTPTPDSQTVPPETDPTPPPPNPLPINPLK